MRQAGKRRVLGKGGRGKGNIKQIPFGDCVLPKEEEEEKQEIIILSHFLFATLTLLPHM